MPRSSATLALQRAQEANAQVQVLDMHTKFTELGHTKTFSAQLCTPNIMNDINLVYSLVRIVRWGRSAWRISKLVWQMGKKIGGKKQQDKVNTKAGAKVLKTTGAQCLVMQKDAKIFTAKGA